MGLQRIVYVSECLVSASVAKRVIGELVGQSHDRNLKEGISGCLLYSVTHFAQVLEGDDESVRRVMASILKDPRHRNISVLEDRAAVSRLFRVWGLGYGGPSLYVNRAIQGALADVLPGRPKLANLKLLMTEFAAAA